MVRSGGLVIPVMLLVVFAVTSIGYGKDKAGTSFKERAAFFEAVALAQAFLDCVEISANESVPDDDQAANDRAEACFNQVLSDDFVNTIDGVGFGPPPPGAIGGTVFFPTPQSFIDFANGPADDVRENLRYRPEPIQRATSRERMATSGSRREKTAA